MTIAIALVGGLLTLAQALTLFVLTDLRSRIMRLEERQMAK